MRGFVRGDGSAHGGAADGVQPAISAIAATVAKTSEVRRIRFPRHERIVTASDASASELRLGYQAAVRDKRFKLTAPSRVLALLIASSIEMGAVTAVANGRATAVLEWRRAPGAERCLDRDGLARAVESRLGRSVFASRSGADLAVEVDLTRSEGRWRAQVVLRDTQGQRYGARELRTAAADCSALDEALVLAIALMIDISRDELPEVSSAPARPTRAAPSPATPIELPPQTHAPREPWAFHAGVLGGLAVGLLPELAAGGTVSVGVDPPSFWLTELDATLWPARETEAAGEGAEFAMVSVGLYLCPLDLGPQETRVALCAGQELGQLRASGFGFDRNDERTRLIYDLALRVRLSQRLVGPLRLLAGAGVRFPVSRDRFVAQEGDGTRREVFERPLAAATLQLGIGLDFH